MFMCTPLVTLQTKIGILGGNNSTGFKYSHCYVFILRQNVPVPCALVTNSVLNSVLMYIYRNY